MTVYPEIESWNEFYPGEIFMRMGETETIDDAFPVFKNAKIGTTIYLGMSPNETRVFKKIGDIEALPDMDSSLLILVNVSASNNS